MKVQRSHLRIAVIVLVAAVGYNLWAYFRPAQRSGAVVNRQQQQPLLPSESQATGPQAVDPLTIPAPPSFDASVAPGSGRDPFLFGDERRDGVVRAAETARVPDPQVRTILYSSTRKTALVENRMVSVGDSVGSLKVVAIDKDAVVFVSSNGERRRVALYRATSSGIRR